MPKASAKAATVRSVMLQKTTGTRRRLYQDSTSRTVRGIPSTSVPTAILFPIRERKGRGELRLQERPTTRTPVRLGPPHQVPPEKRHRGKPPTPSHQCSPGLSLLQLASLLRPETLVGTATRKSTRGRFGICVKPLARSQEVIQDKPSRLTHFRVDPEGRVESLEAAVR